MSENHDDAARFGQAATRGDHAEALELALGRWRRSRDATIGAAIESLSARALRDYEPPRASAGFHKLWLGQLDSANAVVMGWLASTVFVKLPGTNADDKLEGFQERLRALRAVAADPRIGSALLELLAQAAPIVTWAHADCCKTLQLHADERTPGAIESLIQQEKDPADVRRLRALIKRLPEPEAPLSEAERKSWSGLKGATLRVQDRDSLFRAVVETPEADEPRAVLADWLQEQGDPRGEFIALQLAEAAGQATTAMVKRAQALLNAHKKTWLESLARVAYRALYARGFLVELDLNGSWKASAKAWSELAHHPLLGTVEELGGKATDAIYAQFVTSPAMCALRRVTVWSDPLVDALEKQPPRQVREVRCHGWTRHDYAGRFASRLLPLLEALPALEAVDCAAELLEVLMHAPAFGRLSRLALHGVGYVAAAELWDRLPEHILVLRWGYEGELELSRVGAATHGLIRADAADLDEALHALASLRTLRRLVVEASPKAAPRDLASRFGHSGVDLVVVEPPLRSGLCKGLSG